MRIKLFILYTYEIAYQSLINKYKYKYMYIYFINLELIINRYV